MANTSKATTPFSRQRSHRLSDSENYTITIIKQWLSMITNTITIVIWSVFQFISIMIDGNMQLWSIVNVRLPLYCDFIKLLVNFLWNYYLSDDLLSHTWIVSNYLLLSLDRLIGSPRADGIWRFYFANVPHVRNIRSGKPYTAPLQPKTRILDALLFIVTGMDLRFILISKQWLL